MLTQAPFARYFDDSHDAFRAACAAFVDNEIAPHANRWEEEESFPRELQDAYEPEEEERVLKTTSGVNVAMLKLGAMLRECAGDAGRMETTLRTLASGFTELPTMPQLMGLLRTEEGAPTLEEFLDVYDAALDVDLDSENVWPMPPPLRF